MGNTVNTHGSGNTDTNSSFEWNVKRSIGDLSPQDRSIRLPNVGFDSRTLLPSDALQNRLCDPLEWNLVVARFGPNTVDRPACWPVSTKSHKKELLILRTIPSCMAVGTRSRDLFVTCVSSVRCTIGTRCFMTWLSLSLSLSPFCHSSRYLFNPASSDQERTKK